MRARSPELERILAEWPNIHRAVTLSALRFLGPDAQIDDLAHDVLVGLLDGSYRYDPVAHPDIARFVFGKVKGLYLNGRRNAKRERERLRLANARGAAECSPGPEEILNCQGSENLRRYLIERLRAAFPEDRIERKVLDLALDDGIAEPGVVAERLGVRSDQVHKARQRLTLRADDFREHYLWELHVRKRVVGPEPDPLTREEVDDLAAYARMPPEELDREIAKAGGDAEGEERWMEAQRAAERATYRPSFGETLRLIAKEFGRLFTGR
jgi:DNA-directed RNA polymerase specialized sigma24 family protein